MRTPQEETKDQMIARYRKELKDDLQETYEGHCVLQDHGTFTGTFQGFLNNPLGCNSCLQQGLITWDRDINESLVWDAMRKMITEKKAAEQQAAEEEVTSMIIDKNVPVQKGWHRAKKLDELYYTINAMEIGDSIFFKDFKEAGRFRARASNYRRTEPDFTKDFVIRKLDDGWRVWRTQ
jgi:hypothetical protein